MQDLPENLGLREFRVDARYRATRLAELEETRALARELEEAQEKFALLEEEEARLALRRAEMKALIESADEAWDEVMSQFLGRLLELAGGSRDHELYRKYFTDVPSHVTHLSCPAEVMISKDLEAALHEESHEELRPFEERLRAKRIPLENLLLEHTRLEVEEARFQNRVSLAKAIANKIRRQARLTLQEVAAARGRSPRASMRSPSTAGGELVEGGASRAEVLTSAPSGPANGVTVPGHARSETSP